MYVKTDDTKRITATSQTFPLGDGEFDFPEGFDFERQADWLIQDGVLISDPLPEPKSIQDPSDALAAENKLLKAQIQALEARSDFMESRMTEMNIQINR